MPMPKKVAAALKGLDAARDALTDAVRSELPAGSAISWWHGQHRQYGSVVDHGYSGRVMVENESTGRRRWLRPTDLVL